MKKILFPIMCLFAITANAQETNFSVAMKLAAGDTSTKYYILRDNGTKEPLVDSVLVADGNIQWSANIDKPVDAMLLGNEESRKHRYQLVMVPDGQAVITVEGEAYYVSGSRFYEESDAADRYAEKIISSGSAEAQGKSPEIQKHIREQIVDRISDYVKQHNTEEGVIIMSNYLGFGVLEKLLSSSVRNGLLKEYIAKKVAEEKAAQEAEAAEEAKIAAMNGQPAPDFTLTDIKGKPLSLSSLRGKYVVLDFWGSWCVWCIRGIPKMKEYYKKYSGKFEILGIDCNDTDAKWRDAVEKYEIPWLHVYNPKTSSVLADYNVQGFPTKILIDPEGKIVRVIVGEDPKFYEFMDNTFSK